MSSVGGIGGNSGWGGQAGLRDIMQLRAQVMIHTTQRLKAQGWTQAEAAKHLGITQPRVSRLMQGKAEDFSLDMLLTLAARAGLNTEIRMSSRLT